MNHLSDDGDDDDDVQCRRLVAKLKARSTRYDIMSECLQVYLMMMMMMMITVSHL